MSSRMDAKLNALTTELASAAPLAPPMPELRRAPSTTAAGIRTAVLAFGGVVIVALVGLAGWLSVSDDGDTVASSAVFESTGAIPVAVTMHDGEQLRGYVWEGGTDGVVVVPGYGSLSTDVLSIATSAHSEGATVLLVEPRGQGDSGGVTDATLLVSDLSDSIAYLTNRGAASVVVIGVRHAATAAVALAAQPSEALHSVIAFFPFEQYQGIDAIGVVSEARVPLTIVGASSPSDLGPWAGNLTREAPDGTVGILLPPLPPDQRFIDFYRDAMLDIVSDVLTEL